MPYIIIQYYNSAVKYVHSVKCKLNTCTAAAAAAALSSHISTSQFHHVLYNHKMLHLQIMSTKVLKGLKWRKWMHIAQVPQ